MMRLRTQRRKWKAAVVKWQKKLLLGGYNIAIEYLGDDDDDLVGRSELPSGSWEWVAKVETKPMYLQARLKVANSFLRDASDEDIDTKVAHELVHVLTGQMGDFMRALIEELPKGRQQGYWDWWHRVNEFTTTHISRVVGAGSGS